MTERRFSDGQEKGIRREDGESALFVRGGYLFILKAGG